LSYRTERRRFYDYRYIAMVGIKHASIEEEIIW